jgi:RimJ/RimL family protein N-acetyltransferase
MDTLNRPFLAGENIYLSPLDMDHVNENYLKWINDEEVIQFLEIAFPTTMEKLEGYVKSILDNPNCLFLAIIERETQKHIGNLKIGPIDWISRIAGHGILIGDKSSWGKGYASEAIKLLVKYAFRNLNLHKVWSIIVDSHMASIKAHQNAGFRIEGKLKQHLFKSGKYVDAAIISITSDEYFRQVKTA